jgi:hypothetical protein
MSFNFKLHGKLDISSIKERLIGLDWEDYQFRQKTFSHHSRTKTVPLMWDEDQVAVKYCKDYSLFEFDLKFIGDLLVGFLGEGKIETAILINLPKREKIISHYDRGEYFSRRNRIHIPIITNKDCIFEIDGELKNMKEGEIWEINNDEKKHSVENNGTKDRIHLLIDFLPKTEKSIKNLV